MFAALTSAQRKGNAQPPLQRSLTHTPTPTPRSDVVAEARAAAQERRRSALRELQQRSALLRDALADCELLLCRTVALAARLPHSPQLAAALVHPNAIPRVAVHGAVEREDVLRAVFGVAAAEAAEAEASGDGLPLAPVRREFVLRHHSAVTAAADGPSSGQSDGPVRMFAELNDLQQSCRLATVWSEEL